MPARWRASKKGVSAHQLHRTLEVTCKAAWFLAHRIREARRSGEPAPMGGNGAVVAADETHFGKTEEQPATRTSGKPFKSKTRRGPSGKRAMVALAERGGNVRSFHVDRAGVTDVASIVATNVLRETVLNTEESRLYTKIGARSRTIRRSVTAPTNTFVAMPIPTRLKAYCDLALLICLLIGARKPSTSYVAHIGQLMVPAG